MSDTLRLCLFTLVLALALSASTQAEVIINELHIDPDVKTERVEFVELHNTGASDVDLSGWHFSDGVLYTFPEGSALRAGGYIIVAQDPAQIHAKWSSGRWGISRQLVFGPYGGKLRNEGERIVLCHAAGQIIDEVEYQLGFPWPTVGDPVSENQPGTGSSMQLVNPIFDNDLGGSWRSAQPTPAEKNRGYRDNLPPHSRQVRHSPRRPKSGDVVTLTAKVTDADGVQSVMLLYQVVTPGNYVARHDAQYSGNWSMVEMHDDGLAGDVRAADDLYTVQLPASLQVHRRLIRYKLVLADTVGNSVIVPYPDDPAGNFAYFVYDGVPAWRGAVQPGITPVIEFPAEVMRSLPVYHLISKKADVEEATWLAHDGGSSYRWWGTLVYDGRVYDHIRYRMRGGVWRYAMGKNMFKFDFNRGHAFQARDDYGNAYDTTWDKLNFSACIQQGSFGQRGEQGMFEALSFKLFNMAGVPASKTNYLHFRIIDELHEDGTLNAAHPPLTSGGTQYDGDFWGLYMTIEQMDGRFLDEHGLPDGNLYKMDNNNHETNNQGPTQPADQSDLNSFLIAYRNASASWWRANVNLEAYYGYYAAYQAVHHGDITGKNWFLYHHPETHQWWQLPWDVDLTWTTYYGSDNPSDPFSREGLLGHGDIAIENRNRAREYVDLLFNSDQTNQLIDEFAAIINDPGGGPSIVDADRAMWDYHWVVGTGAYPQYLNRQASQKAGQGRFYEEAQQRGYGRTFEGMVEVMKEYVVERLSRMARRTSDSAIPNTPSITATGPADFPINALTFRTGPFSDPQGTHTFAAMKWRIAEVTPGSQAVVQPDSGLVLIPDGADWRYFKGLTEPSAVPGAWRRLNYDDSHWLLGRAPIGYGEPLIVTELPDMRGRYSTIYLRRVFEVDDLQAFDTLTLDVTYDDAVNIWINGRFAFGANVASAEMPHTGVANGSTEPTSVRRALGAPADYLVAGENIIAIQVLNQSLGSSSDLFIDARLVGEMSPGAGDEPSTPRLYRRQPGRYEIDAVWEGPELTTFEPDVTIPATGLRPARTYRVRCRMKDNTGRWSHWSNPVQFVAGEPLAAGILADLRITEVMYNPPEPVPGADADNDDYEFVELKNIGDETLDLSTVAFVDGIDFDFGRGDVTTLGPGRFVLLVANRQAFEDRYGSALSGTIAGEYEGRLANGGENVRLEDLWNGTIAEFEYTDGTGWPVAADGGGHSMVPLAAALVTEPQGSLSYPGNWRAGASIGGSPGMDDPSRDTPVVINEFMANAIAQGAGDWIELYNPTDVSVSLAGWFLSDDVDDPGKWALPEIAVGPHAYVSVDDVDGFGLDRAGEELVLSYLPGTAEDRIVDAVRFKAQEEGISMGRYPDGGPYWFRLTPSRDASNASPIRDVVIDEVMYHPVDANDEYVELLNPTDGPLEFHGAEGVWRLDGAVAYTFEAGLSMPAGGRLVVVGFDPFVDVSRLGVFAAVYGAESLTPGVDIVGPWSGNLSNRSERVALEKPQLSDDPGDPIAWVVVDEVIYGDVAPWPESPDGWGDALQRIEADAFHAGNDPANWQAATPTPGRAP